MIDPITTRIIKIGNSQGVRIPKSILEQVDLGDEIILEVDGNTIVIKPARPVRYDWESQFKKIAESEPEYATSNALNESLELANDFDEDEWEW